MNLEKFDWEESTSVPTGYPIEVYRGGLKSPNGQFASLFGGITTSESGWGTGGGGWGGGIRSLPSSLHVKWMSYAEDCMYEIDTPIDYDKILALFKKGYYDTLRDPKSPPFKREYDVIRVGFAPGGVVVVWVEGAGRQIDVGRYQGQKITVSQKEIAQLDKPNQLIFNKAYRDRLMKKTAVVPQAIQDAHKDKPIPFGKWDSIRKRYKWKINLELPKTFKSKEAAIIYYNGEMEALFGQTQIEQFEIEEYLKLGTVQDRAVPKLISFRWFNNKDSLKVGRLKFNKQEVFTAFAEVFKDQKEGDTGKAVVNIRVNDIETNAAVQIIGNNKQVWLPNTKVKVFN